MSMRIILPANAGANPVRIAKQIIQCLRNCKRPFSTFTCQGDKKRHYATPMASLHLLSPQGFAAAGAAAGIKLSGKMDVGLLTCASPATAAAVFTTNRVFAAPIKVGRAHIAGGKLRGIVVNSGNANACTGKRGYNDAVAMCRLAADALGCAPSAILPSSTGIIGHLLPMKKIRTGIAAA